MSSLRLELRAQYWYNNCHKDRFMNTRTAAVPDESLMTPEEIRAMLEQAKESGRKQIASGDYITIQNVRDGLREEYALDL